MSYVTSYAESSYPNWDSVKANAHAMQPVQPYDDDAYSGGSCLKIVRADSLFDSDYIR
jgi:hypothetical protein